MIEFFFGFTILERHSRNFLRLVENSIQNASAQRARTIFSLRFFFYSDGFCIIGVLLSFIFQHFQLLSVFHLAPHFYTISFAFLCTAPRSSAFDAFMRLFVARFSQNNRARALVCAIHPAHGLGQALLNILKSSSCVKINSIKHTSTHANAIQHSQHAVHS